MMNNGTILRKYHGIFMEGLRKNDDRSFRPPVWRSGGKPSRILNLDNEMELSVQFHAPAALPIVDTRLGELQSRYGNRGESNKLENVRKL